jgi:tetratricopeptide (TPR) repeat protein
MLKHFVKIYQKEKNYKEAIYIQQKIVVINPKERDPLVRLYVMNRQYKEAISLMNDLEKENTLSSYLKSLKLNLEKRKGVVVVEKENPSDLSSLITQFITEKSYSVLEKILIKSTNNSVLLKFSEEGITLFPAQPYVYLVRGKALNNKKDYKKALTTLNNGIDFVIEDKMEIDFYMEMVKAYKSLGNTKDKEKYQQKVKKLKS